VQFLPAAIIVWGVAKWAIHACDLGLDTRVFGPPKIRSCFVRDDFAVATFASKLDTSLVNGRIAPFHPTPSQHRGFPTDR